MNKLLPRTNVSWASALIGALVTALMLEGLKFGFVRFAAQIVQGYGGVYGPLGLVPLVLVWIYSSWVLVLLGAEIALAARTCVLWSGGPALSAATRPSTACSPRSSSRPSRRRTRRRASATPRRS